MVVVVATVGCDVVQTSVVVATLHAFGLCGWEVEPDVKDNGHAVADAALYATTVVSEGESVALAVRLPLVGVFFLRKAEGFWGVAHGKCHG